MSHNVSDRKYNPWKERMRTFDMTPTFPSVPFIPKDSMSSEKRKREGVKNSRLWVCRQHCGETLTSQLFRRQIPIWRMRRMGPAKPMQDWQSGILLLPLQPQHLSWQHFVCFVFAFVFVCFFPHKELQKWWPTLLASSFSSFCRHCLLLSPKHTCYITALSNGASPPTRRPRLRLSNWSRSFLSMQIPYCAHTPYYM